MDSNYEPPRGLEEQHQRDQMITRLLNAEIASHKVAWPFQLHRGRWRILDKFLPPRVGALKEWVQARPEEWGSPSALGIRGAFPRGSEGGGCRSTLFRRGVSGKIVGATG